MKNTHLFENPGIARCTIAEILPFEVLLSVCFMCAWITFQQGSWTKLLLRL